MKKDTYSFDPVITNFVTHLKKKNPKQWNLLKIDFPMKMTLPHVSFQSD